MKKHILFVIVFLMVVAPLTVKASTPSLIRTDRVWEYVMNATYGFDTDEMVWSRYRFEGTEEKYGKEYTRLMRVSKVSLSWIRETGVRYPTQFDDTKECVALLREENGRVYMLAPSTKIEVPNYEYPGDTIERSVEADTEFLLYDFTAGEGEVADYLTGYLTQWEEGNTYILTPEKVVSVMEEDAGELGTLKKFTLQNGLITMWATGKSILTDSGGYDFSMDPSTMEAWKNSLMAMYVEGIGNVGCGDLIHVSTGEYNRSTGGTTYEERLNNVYDLEGNIIYEGANKRPPVGKFIIDKNREWEYWEHEYLFSLGRSDNTLTRYRFGDEEEVNGRRYTRLERIRSVSQTWIEGVASEPVVDESVVCTALLREEAGRVYLLSQAYRIPEYTGGSDFDSFEVNSYEGSSWKNGTEGEEFLLYDFSSPVGRDIEMLLRAEPVGGIGGSYEVLTPARIESTSVNEYGDLGLLRSVRVQNGVYTAMLRREALRPDKDAPFDYTLPDSDIFEEGAPYSEYIEGIGNIGFGTLTEVGTQGYILFATNGCNFTTRLNNVYDLEGNIIYKGVDYKIDTTDASRSVEGELSRNEDNVDLMGRRISDPLPGTVYIRGGRKFVAR